MRTHIRDTLVAHGGFSFGVHTTYDHATQEVTTDKLHMQMNVLDLQQEAQDSYGRCVRMRDAMRDIPLHPVWARDAFLSRVAAMLVEG